MPMDAHRVQKFINRAGCRGGPCLGEDTNIVVIIQPNLARVRLAP